MFPTARFPRVRKNAVSQRRFSPRVVLSGWPLAAAVTLSFCVLLSLPLDAQTAHYGAVVTLGSGFSTPTGVAVDAYGNVFVADNGNSAVKEIMAVNGSIPASPVINTLGSGFANPYTAAVDSNGNVFVADYGNHAVKEIEAVNGSIPASPTIRTLASGLSFVFGTAVDANGDFFFTEYGKDEVKEIVAVNGVIPPSPKTFTLGGGFNIPAGVAVDANGNVFIGDQNNNVVKEILASSGYTTVNTIATGFNTDDGVAVDRFGNVYVADDGNNVVKKVVAVNGVIPPSPTIVTLATGFSQPFDVAVDLSGNVYVADRGNNAVKEIQVGGVNFGQVNVGSSSSSPITLSFTFDTGGTLGSIAVLTQGAAAGDFTYVGGGSCAVQTAYAAGAVCTVNVNFTPSAAGPRYGAVNLVSGTGALVATGYLQGTGVGPQTTFANTSSGAVNPSLEIPVGSGFSSPGGVGMDGNRNVFVADSGNNSVKEIFAAGTYGSINNLGTGFNFPNGLAVDGAGNVFVADTFNQAVKEIVAVGGYTTVQTLGSGFDAPYGVAVDGSGNIFVADYATNTVKELVALNGSIPALPTIRVLASGFDGPDGVAVDGNGNVFVANYNTNTVQEIVAVNGVIPAAPAVRDIGGGFSGPSNLAVDSAGNVFVSDTNNSAVKEILAAGGYATVITLSSGFNSPEAVAVDKSGNVVIADTLNNAVDYLDYTDTPTLNFTSTPVGQESIDSPQTATVSNNGNAPLIFPLPNAGFNPSVPANFVWDPSSTCARTAAGSSNAFELAAGESCTMSFDFEPAMAGNISGAVVVVDNNLNQVAINQLIQLSGTGLQGSQTIKFTQPASPVLYGVSPITLIATGGPSGNPVTFSIVSGPGSLSGANNSLLTVTGGGTIVIAANQAGNTNYAAAQQVTVNVVADQAATMTSPASGTLGGPHVTFTWSAGFGVTSYALSLGTTGVGSSNLYVQSGTTATSQFVTVLPTNGATIYARLSSKINGVTYSTDYAYTAAAQAVLTTPTPSGTLVGPSVKFTWTAATGSSIQGYWLFLGTTGVGSKDLYDSGQQTATSATFTRLPNTGETIYARVYTRYAGTLVYNDYTYSAVTQAVLTTPTPGSTLPGTSATFKWTAAVGPGIQGYWLYLGTTGVGSKNLYDSGQTISLSATFSGLPTNGATIYARVYTKYNSTLVYNDYTYEAAAQAVLTTPAPGTSLISSSTTFKWTAATGSGVQGYWLFLGTTGVGSKDLYDSGEQTATSATFNKLPANGATIYARVYTSYNGVLVYSDRTYRSQ